MASTLKRRKLNPATPEIVFDDSARAEFLTGFHKRKQARIKQAQELAAKIERRDKLQDRATLRRERREQVEAHVAAITAALREANDLPNEEAQEFEEWQGIEEEVDHEDEYVDEDKFTTVTVEAVGVSRDGFTRPGDASGSESEAEVDAPKGRGGREQAPKAKPPRKRSAAKSKRRNFRYESKEERSATRFKEKRKLLRRKMARQERKK